MDLPPCFRFPRICIKRRLLVVVLSVIVITIVAIVSLDVYLHFNPLDWPFSGFIPYVPAGTLEGLGIRTSPPERIPLRTFLPPHDTNLYFSFGRYHASESTDWGSLSTTNVTRHGQKYKLIYNESNSGPSAVFTKGVTTIQLYYGAAPIAKTELDKVIDSFRPTHLRGVPVQYDSYNGTV
jgi:hypothetical protein